LIEALITQCMFINLLRYVSTRDVKRTLKIRLYLISCKGLLDICAAHLASHANWSDT